MIIGFRGITPSGVSCAGYRQVSLKLVRNLRTRIKAKMGSDQAEESRSYGSLLHQQDTIVTPPLGAGNDIHPPSVRTTKSTATRSISYCEFLSNNRNYRWYITSYLITHFGEWLTYIASIDFIETVRASNQESTSRTALSILILVRLLPNVLLSVLGGTLADSVDRRHAMIALDISGALCAVLFILAYQWQSIPWLYIASCVQQCIAGLYAPSHSAIVPQLVQSDAQLKKATTLEGLTWSVMQALGAAASGWIVGALGIRMCFVVDGLSYGISAIGLGFVSGSYKVIDDTQKVALKSSTSSANGPTISPLRHFYKMAIDGGQYLYQSYFGALVFLKGTAALGYGACDILNVAFAEQTPAGEVAAAMESNGRIGILFSLVGVGCLVGPLVAEPWIHVERPITLQTSCLLAFLLSTVGYFGWATIPYFWSICIFAVIRAAGSSNIWIHSTLLLQKLSAPRMLGRVLATDYAIALVGEALAAYLCGVFMDNHPTWTPYQISMTLAILTTVLTGGWLFYQIAGRGAGRHKLKAEQSETGRGPQESSNLNEL